MFKSAFRLLILKIMMTVSSEERNLIDTVIIGVTNSIDYISSLDKIDMEIASLVQISSEQLRAFLDEINLKCFDVEKLLKKKNVVLETLQQRLETLANETGVKVMSTSPIDYQKFNFLLKKNLWKVFEKSKTIHEKLMYKRKNLKYMNITQDKAENCLIELRDNKCNASESCWKYLTEPNHVRQYLSHETWYIFMARLLGCEEKVLTLSQEFNHNASVQQLLRITCSNSFAEVWSIAAKKSSEMGEKSLMLEHVGTCGMLGFGQFFQQKWIERMISWQLSLGCFTVEEKEKFKCSNHLTSVALLALQQSIRYLLGPQLARHCKAWRL